MAKTRKKQVTEIRDDIFFRKLLDVSKNAVFIGWSGVYRKEYQSLLLENLPYLRELSIIQNANFSSTNISVALYVFSEKTAETYVSRVYDGDTVAYEETFEKKDVKDRVEYVSSVPIPPEDLRPKISDFFQTVSDYMEWEAKQRLNKRLQEIRDWEDGKTSQKPWEELKEERIEWEEGGNSMMSDLSFRNYLKTVNADLYLFKQTGDMSILYTLQANLLSLIEFGRQVDIQIGVIEALENENTKTSQ